jgi:hypothetical protein
VANLLAKYDRVEQIYRQKVSDTPQIVYDTFAAIRRACRMPKLNTAIPSAR